MPHNYIYFAGIKQSLYVVGIHISCITRFMDFGFSQIRWRRNYFYKDIAIQTSSTSTEIYRNPCLNTKVLIDKFLY